MRLHHHRSTALHGALLDLLVLNVTETAADQEMTVSPHSGNLTPGHRPATTTSCSKSSTDVHLINLQLNHHLCTPIGSFMFF